MQVPLDVGSHALDLASTKGPRLVFTRPAGSPNVIDSLLDTYEDQGSDPYTFDD